MEKYLPVICASRLFAGISQEEVGELLDRLQARVSDFPRGDYILRAGERTESLGLLLSGQALIIHEDYWGTRNILTSMVQGQCFGEAFACAPGSLLNVSVVAQAPCQVLFLNVGQMLGGTAAGCACYDRMLRNLLSDLARKNLTFSEKLSHVGQRSTRAKILSYLSAESQRQGKAEFDIPFTRQQLADYLFVERSGLSQELSRMQREGLLTFSRNHFCLH